MFNILFNWHLNQFFHWNKITSLINLFNSMITIRNNNITPLFWLSYRIIYLRITRLLYISYLLRLYILMWGLIYIMWGLIHILWGLIRIFIIPLIFLWKINKYFLLSLLGHSNIIILLMVLNHTTRIFFHSYILNFLVLLELLRLIFRKLNFRMSVPWISHHLFRIHFI